ncbi:MULTISPECIES: ATP-dependent Clp protease proteolytic subunit [unclassified Streptomyces]|uniref:ATP-dependent Clp protease proteolytic subunit n=1 Tax=unclassified Streptomyces TaxID=2593676 RepID=UPI00081F5A81|nr:MULTISPECIES: ATP-dependent Clp protease proteolytic subunit [unclassified Streptomyces]MYZ40699.1 ATP-dependent Clp protease proteolytic subunit [Streptomyces sp. SID4917]SCG08384.1 ATP-dependent Clp protease, protease subunit [Streptomyces sp. MnatMP-M17]
MNRPSARYVLPEFTERTTNGTRTLDPYSKLLEERIIFLGTAVDDTAANDVIAQFLHLEYAAPDRDICLYINSPGGSISAMSAIYDTMQLVTCDVETTCLGQAASTAAVLLAAGTRGKRMALPGARVVLQQPAIEEPVRGQPSDLVIHAEELLRLRAVLTSLLVRHTGQGEPRIAEDIERDRIFTAADAKAYGLIDHVVQNRKTSLGPTHPFGSPGRR